MIWTKGAHQSAKFQTFDCSRNISSNLYFDSLLKVYILNFSKEVQRSYISWPWRLIQNLKKNWSVVSKMTGIWWNLTQTLKSLKNVHFHLLLFCKVFNVWPKKLLRSWLLVCKMAWGMSQIFTRALERLKIGTLMGSFNPK